MITLHARTRSQFYEGRADWSAIGKLKRRVSIPVVGNGDVTSPETAIALMDETGCDGVMIGRAVRGNPWLFSEILYYMEMGHHKARPTIEEVKTMILKHARMQVEVKGEYTALREMRKHVAWYTAGFPHSARLRARTNEISTMEELVTLLQKLMR